MRITEIVKAKSTRYTIYVDNEYWYIIDLEIVMKNNLEVGMFVDEDFLEDIKYQAQKRKARERAYYLLGYRDHSKKELYDKLLKSASPEVCLEIIELVEGQGLLDDEEYANKLARHYANQKKLGLKRAVFEMYKKGIDKEMATQAYLDCEVDPIEQIILIINKKYSYCLDDFKGKQKLIAAVMRLGYSYDDIKAALDTYGQDSNI